MSLTSLTEHVASFDAGAEIVGAAFLKGAPALALASGEILIGAPGAQHKFAAHGDGAILCFACDGRRLISGGDDGRVVATDSTGASELLGEEKGWIDALTIRGDGALAWSSGKTVRARDAKGEIKSFVAPSSVRGLAFFPKGYRLAVAHYNGASLWFPNTAAAPEKLEWKGAHLDATLSPDGKFLVTSMQENALHGWRLADRKDMRMSGYPAKTRSLAWSHDGLWLATSGADACVVWPFSGKDGPMGQAPRECGVRPDVLVSAVAFHPEALVLAIGYDDGWILLVRLSDAAEILVRRTEAEAPRDAITALAFDAKGEKLLFGARSGQAGLLDFPG